MRTAGQSDHEGPQLQPALRTAFAGVASPKPLLVVSAIMTHMLVKRDSYFNDETREPERIERPRLARLVAGRARSYHAHHLQLDEVPGSLYTRMQKISNVGKHLHGDASTFSGNFGRRSSVTFDVDTAPKQRMNCLVQVGKETDGTCTLDPDSINRTGQKPTSNQLGVHTASTRSKCLPPAD